MDHKNKNAPNRQNSQIEEDMENLECPFTWSMEEILKIKGDDVEYHLNDDEDSFPLLQLMRHIMSVYVETKTEIKCEDEVWEILKKCDEIMKILKESVHPAISMDVVQYILRSTKCFVFKQLNLPEKVAQTLSKIKKGWSMSNKEKSTLDACRSICWSKYHRVGTSHAERFIRYAIEKNPNCELWHFILAKNLRRKRRDSTINARPSSEEINSFEKAYNMSANPVFGIFLAQMYREMRTRIHDAKRIYHEIYKQNPTSTTVLLRLALGFIRLKDYEKAKECLDKVEEVTPNYGMYLHYRGIYHLDRKNYGMASKYLKEASKNNNIPAEKQYLDCAVMLDPTFDVVDYLYDMVCRYSRLPDDQTQPLLLDLAVAYWLKRRDIPNAIKYFIQAVKMNPKAKCITNYFTSIALPISERNMYKLLHKEILIFVLRNKASFDKSCILEAEELQRHCDGYFSKQFNSTLNSFSRFSLKN